jgi:hypothetical protein
MSQIIIPEGIQIGSRGFYIFASVGNPNNYSGQGLLVQRNAGQDVVCLGSHYTDVSTGTVWFKTGMITPTALAGTWTALTLP